MPKSIERAEGEGDGEAKLEALLLCCLFARLPRPAACPIASCQLPFWGANPFKFCLMSLNCCRCTSQAALRVSLSPLYSSLWFFATLPPQLATCTNVPNCRKCLFECPEDAATFMASARVDCTLRRRVVARRPVDKSSASVARLTDRQTDSPEVAAVPAQVINTHVKRGNPQRGGGSVGEEGGGMIQQ